MKTIEELKKGTSVWNQIRWNPTEIKFLLEEGSFFKISKEMYLNWSKMTSNPKWIHAYPAYMDDQLMFILIDSETDKSKIDDLSLKHIFVEKYCDNYSVDSIDFLKNLEDNPDGNIKVDDALKRVMRWSIMRESWIEDQIDSMKDNQVGIFRAFIIPFGDLEKAFSGNEDYEIIVNLGLKERISPLEKSKEKLSKFVADLLLWGVNKKDKTSLLISKTSIVNSDVDDLVEMVPPFGSGGSGPGESNTNDTNDKTSVENFRLLQP